MITNPVTLDLILLVYTSLLTYYIIKKKRNGQAHSFDIYFSALLIPYILLLSLTSATVAAQEAVLTSFSITAIALTALTITITRVNNLEKAYIMESIIGLTALTILFMNVKPDLETSILLQMTGLTIAAFVPVYMIHLSLEKKTTGMYLFPVFAHFLDAGSTVAALERGLKESRALAQLFISSMGEYGIFIMKALIIIPIALYLEKKVEGEISREILFMIGSYGVVLGLRNYFLLLI